MFYPRHTATPVSTRHGRVALDGSLGPLPPPYVVPAGTTRYGVSAVRGVTGVPLRSTAPVTAAYVTAPAPSMSVPSVSVVPSAVTVTPPVVTAQPAAVPVQLPVFQSLDNFGLSVNIGVPPDPEDNLTNLSPAERLAEMRRKKEFLRQQLEQCPDDKMTLYKLHQVYVDLDEVGQFRAFVRDFCRRHRSTWRTISRLLRKYEPEREVAGFLEEVHRDLPDNAEVCCMLAKTEQHRARFWYEEALKADPKCFDALQYIADDLRKAERYTDAFHHYEALHRLRPDSSRLLLRMGECLVMDGREEDAEAGRQYLKQVLEHPDGASYHMHAAVKIAWSYTKSQNHECALEYCQKAEEIHRRSPQQHSEPELKHALLYKGITLLRKDDIERSIETLQTAMSDPSTVDGETRWVNQMIACTLGLAETRRGDFAAAERYLDESQGWCADVYPDFLVNLAYLRQAQGSIEAAQSVLQRCLAKNKDMALALLRMGYLYLCQEQYELAIQFLQKCLQQPTSLQPLTYGTQEKGLAHLYLCIAYHWRVAAEQRAAVAALAESHRSDGAMVSRVGGSFTVEPGLGEQLAEEQFRLGYESLPDIAGKLAEFDAINSSGSLSTGRTSLAASGLSMSTSSSILPLTGQHLVCGSPPRMGYSDLLPKQASVLLLYAERAGNVPSSALRSHAQVVTSPLAGSARRPLGTSPGPVHILGGSQTAPLTGGSPVADESASKPGGSTPQLLGIVGGGGAPTLVGTASTAAGTSCGPSRDASDRDLLNQTTPQPLFPPTPHLAPIGGVVSPSGARLPSGIFRGAAQGDRATLSDESIAAAVELSIRLPSEKLLRFSDLDMGECISCGEFAIVHRGVIRDTQREVVVKTLHQRECRHDEQAAAELRAEISVIAELSHPRLVTFVGACLEPSSVALVTELAPGGNLHQALHVRRRSLQRHERFQLSIELLEGVRYLHARNPAIAHLDLKSMNLVLDADGQHLQICDFGLARVMVEQSERDDGEAGGSSSSDTGRDRPPSRGGSPRYMSPECHDSTLGELTVKADVWSSGCILIEIFGETLPYSECSNVHQILKLMLVHRCGPDIPSRVEAPVRSIIACTLAFEAQDRLAIAQVLLRLQSVASSNCNENKSRFQWIP